MRSFIFVLLTACKGAESPQAVEITPADAGEQILAMLSPDAEAAFFATPADASVKTADPLASSSNVPAGTSAPMAKGGLPTQDVMRVVAANRQSLRSCYNKKLAADPKYAGKLMLEWTITPGGRVTNVRTASSTFPDPDVPACIEKEVAKWTFPQAGSPTQIALPLAFVSAGGP